LRAATVGYVLQFVKFGCEHYLLNFIGVEKEGIVGSINGSSLNQPFTNPEKATPHQGMKV
jgi:hypothetical protein